MSAIHREVDWHYIGVQIAKCPSLIYNSIPEECQASLVCERSNRGHVTSDWQNVLHS